MLDFLMISTRSGKRGVIEIYPKFIIKKPNDLMIRGGDFYAIWIEERGLWSTDEQDAVQLIDRELDRYAEENRQRFDNHIKVLHMWDAETGMIDTWHKYCQKQMKDCFHMLDEKLIFSNTKTSKKDYASKRLAYPLEDGAINAYDKLISTLYEPEERHKVEWSIGSIVSGESKRLQKFMVLYGAAGTGKSTILNIIQQLFDGYYSVFDAKALGSSSNAFALEAFKSNPLVAIQHDGDLSRIEDNTRLNSLVSHELMTVNEKFKSTYANRFKAFLFMGTNKPVRITDAKSGLIRRLIDVSPSGNKLGFQEYKTLLKQIEFELGAIAYHCQEVYLEDPTYYDNYIPIAMLGASNDFYNFVVDSYHVFKREDGVSLKAAWEMYKTYCDEAKVLYPLSRMVFKEELKNYFREYNERFNLEDGSRVRSYYSGFRTEKFERPVEEEKPEPQKTFIQFDAEESVFDKECADYPAQYATSKETPTQKWEKVSTKLGQLDTRKLHYVKVPENHIVIDFDIPDENGNKCFERNLEEASKWPATYAEISKSGCGIHLHYIYNGDVSQLSRVYDDHIEVKIFTGKSSLRRKLSKCNNLPISTISSGLPLKGESKMVNTKAVQSEKGLRVQIKRNLNKEIHPATKPSIDFIHKILTDAYESGLSYDVTDMRNAVLAFAANSTNQADYCIKLVNKMPFKSADPSPAIKNDDSKLVFYDVEVFPNLFLVNWKIEGSTTPVVRMINPSPQEIEDLMKFRLVGFNCRRYDNHILYARLMGYTNEQLYNLSQRIISTDKKAKSNNCFFGEAYNVSYTDVYDFCSKKQSLKKWEIELGIHHQELGLPWDQPVPENMWLKVAEYCDNDVIATEAVFNARKADFVAREILADVAGLTVNDTTNTLTARIIFGGNRKPQDQFNYRDMGDTTQIFDPEADLPFAPEFDQYTAFDKKKRPIFPGYKFENGKSIYRGEEVGEGGYVYRDGEKVALVRYPHGGTFEIPILTVNNKNPSAVSILGKNIRDAIGINPAVAERLSGADFDGDQVVVIPTGGKVSIKSTDRLEGLKGFDPKTQYSTEGKTGVRLLSKEATQIEMGKISNLITDMTLRGANENELVRAVRHSMVVIDAAKHKLDYKQSEKDNGIAELRKTYQGYTDADGREVGGASTLLSRRKQDVRVPERQGSGRIDKDTGKVIYKESGRTYIDPKTGKQVRATTKAKLLEVTDDIRTLSSGTLQEDAYARYANQMKALANEARKEYTRTGTLKYSSSARATYQPEVDRLMAALRVATLNAPKEREAQRIANSKVKAKVQENNITDKDEISKIRRAAISDARIATGAGGKKTRITITDGEWEAIQAGAISDTTLQQILRYADPDSVRERATPRTTTQLSTARINRIKAMANSGNTNAEIAEALGISTSVVAKYLNE